MASPLFVFAAVLFSARLCLLFLLHFLPGGVHPVRDPVSDYAVGEARRTRFIAAIASWAAAAAWMALGSAVLLRSAPGHAAQGLGAWLLVLGLLLAVMPLVPTDRAGSPATLRGRVHLLFAIAWFTLAYTTIEPLGQLVGDPQDHVLGLLDYAAGIALAALVVSLVLPPLRRCTFGIAERAFILVVTLAPLIASVDLAVQGLVAA
ncbi:DUF998 domain-containing protein [Glutamicibacter sp. AOP5-A2-18]|uniref:DUF998 domain-containing protein n=1 Tax=Glutamicibacter sp. AOP5-A2-18 TaxID=3457656 RepID=UPI004033352D